MQSTSPSLPYRQETTSETGERPAWARRLVLGGLGFFIAQMANPIADLDLFADRDNALRTVLGADFPLFAV